MNNIAFLRGYLQKEAAKAKQVAQAGKTVLKSFGDLPDIVDDVVDVIKGKQVAQAATAADDPLKSLRGKAVEIAHPSGEQVQGIIRGVGKRPGTFEVYYPGTGNTAVSVPAREILGEAVDPHWLREPITRQKKITLRETPAPAGTPAPTSAAPTAEATEAAATAAATPTAGKKTRTVVTATPEGVVFNPEAANVIPQQINPTRRVAAEAAEAAAPPPTTPPPTTPAAGGAGEAATEAGSPAGRAALALIGSGALGGAVGYGAGMATSPTQTDLNNEVRKMELAESKKLLNMLKAHRMEQQMERPGAGKSLYI
jgi:hypothetical protein